MKFKKDNHNKHGRSYKTVASIANYLKVTMGNRSHLKERNKNALFMYVTPLNTRRAVP